MLQPRTNESFVANSDFMKIKGTISIVNFYEQAKTPGLGSLVLAFSLFKPSTADIAFRLLIKTLQSSIASSLRIFLSQGTTISW